MISPGGQGRAATLSACGAGTLDVACHSEWRTIPSPLHFAGQSGRNAAPTHRGALAPASHWLLWSNLRYFAPLLLKIRATAAAPPGFDYVAGQHEDWETSTTLDRKNSTPSNPMTHIGKIGRLSKLHRDELG
jgi:hypothetical protein